MQSTISLRTPSIAAAPEVGPGSSAPSPRSPGSPTRTRLPSARPRTGSCASRSSADFRRAFHYLLAKHCDMVYADVDLERVSAVDEALEALNREGVFYSGVMLLGREGRDQLRLQYENTVDVEDDEIVCYSEFAQELRDHVLADRKTVA